MREMTIDSTELRQLVAQEINLISDDEMAGLYQLVHYFRLGSQIASNGAMVSNNGYHPELLNSSEELNAREDTMDLINENKGASTDDCITHTSSTNESDIDDDDLEEALRAQGWTRPSLFKDDPEFFKLFDEIEEERNRHWVGDNKADWLIFGEAALRAGNFRSLDQIISQALDAWFKQLPSNLRWDIAIDLYTSEEISSGKAAEIAGLNYFVFLDELRAHGIKFIGAEMPEGEEREKQEALLDELFAF